MRKQVGKKGHQAHGDAGVGSAGDAGGPQGGVAGGPGGGTGHGGQIDDFPGNHPFPRPSFDSLHRRRVGFVEVRRVRRRLQLRDGRFTFAFLLRALPPHVLLRENSRAHGEPPRRLHRDERQLRAERCLSGVRREGRKFRIENLKFRMKEAEECSSGKSFWSDGNVVRCDYRSVTPFFIGLPSDNRIFCHVKPGRREMERMNFVVSIY